MDLLERIPPEWRQGPLIIDESAGRPYAESAYGREWRVVARAAGLPSHVWSMDARAGAITEAEDAGADLDHIRSAAAHAQAATMQRSSRGAVGKSPGGGDAAGAPGPAEGILNRSGERLGNASAVRPLKTSGATRIAAGGVEASRCCSMRFGGIGLTMKCLHAHATRLPPRTRFCVAFPHQLSRSCGLAPPQPLNRLPRPAETCC